MTKETFFEDWGCPVYRLQGPPGTGKTYALTEKWIPRAIELHGIDTAHVVSLTRAAAAEIGARANLPRHRVSTLHSLALNALGRPGLAEDSENVKDWNNSVIPEWRLTGASRANRDDLDFSVKSTNAGDDLMARVTVLRNRMIPVEEWDGETAMFYTEWRRWKREMQYADFTDLLSLPMEMNNPAPEGIKSLIVDEAQDLTYLAVALLKHWAPDLKMIVMAGDANQALYGFIGANPYAFMPKGIPDSQITTLKQSYRVPRHPLEYANKWIAQDTEHRIFEYAPRQEDGKTVDGAVSYLPDLTIKDVGPLVRNVSKVIEDGSTAMILTSCRYHLLAITKQLRVSGVPFHNPYRLREGSWNPMRGGVGRLAAFLRPFRPELAGGEEGWTYEDFHRWTSIMLVRGNLRPGSNREIKASKGREGHMSPEEVRLLLTPEAHLDMMDAFTEEDPKHAVAWFESRLNQAGQNLMEMAFNIVKYRGVSELDMEPRVIVGTLHSVKGGAADYVYLAPDLGSSAMKEWDNLANPDGRNATIRAFYVGITRAKKAVALMGRVSRNAVSWI